MAKNSINDYDATAANNTDIQSISLAENVMTVANINNAVRAQMAHLADLAQGNTALTAFVANAGTGFTLNDDADATKQLRWQLSNITTATVRTLTVPDASDTIVTLAEVQTLSNKQLAAPVGVGVAAASADGSGMHVFSGSAGTVAANAAADELVVEGAAAVGMSILAATSQTAGILFGYNTDNWAAGFTHDGANTLLDIGTAEAGGILTLSSAGGVEAVRIDASQGVYIGDTTNADMTVGLTINQGANDDEIVALKSSDVGHGMTTLAETDTFATLTKSSVTNGGSVLNGYAGGAAAAGMQLIATGGALNSTKSASGSGTLVVQSHVKNGTGRTTLGSTNNMIVFRDGATSTRFIFGADGDADASSGWTTFSDERVKKNMDPMLGCLHKVLQMQPVEFDKHSGHFEGGELILEDNPLRRMGFSAQAVEPLFPLAVRAPQASDSLYSLDYAMLVTPLVGAIQELAARVADLEG